VIVTLDFYNLNFYIKVNNCSYVWNSEQDFIIDISYPFTDTKLLSIEPNRNIYHIERSGGLFEATIDSPEISWFLEKEAHIENILQILIDKHAYVTTVEMQRAQYLAETDWLVQRHQEELLRQATPTLDEDQLLALLNYKQELRDITQQYPKDQPAEIVNWPTKPFNF